MSIELKIKFLTLGYEAKQIRRFEQKLKRMRQRKVSVRGFGESQRNTPNEIVPGKNPEGYRAWGNAKLLSLQHHRRVLVSREARHTHLARMFLKGTPYKAAESDARTTPNWNAIQKMAERYARFAKMGTDSLRGEFRSAQDLAQKFEEWRQQS